MKAEIKIGDKVETRGGTVFEITEMPGYSMSFPDAWRGVDHTDGRYGLISYGEISKINGVTINEAEKAMGKKQWPGPEDGLPPVGTGCLMDNARRDWAKVEIIADRDGYRFGWCSEELQVYFSSDPDDFRPIRTEKERVVEAAIQAAGFGEDATIVPIIIGRLYDAGCLKMPESDQ